MNAPSPARYFLTGGLLLDALMLYWVWQDLPLNREPIWIILGPLLMAATAAVPALAVAMKPTPIAVKAAAGMAINGMVLIAGATFFLFVATSYSHNRSDNGVVIVGLALLFVLQVAVVFAASLVLESSLLATLRSSALPAFALWFGALGVHAWVGYMPNLLLLF